MARGGKREGAGRKKGALTKRTQEILAAAAVEGETPLEYMLRVMRDKAADERRRDSMAVAAAAFMHPRLAAVEHSGDKDNPIGVLVASGVPALTHADDDDQRPDVPSH